MRAPAAQDAPWYDCATGRLLPRPLVERAYTTVAAAKALIDVTPISKLRQVLLVMPARTRTSTLIRTLALPRTRTRT